MSGSHRDNLPHVTASYESLFPPQNKTLKRLSHNFEMSELRETQEKVRIVRYKLVIVRLSQNCII